MKTLSLKFIQITFIACLFCNVMLAQTTTSSNPNLSFLDEVFQLDQLFSTITSSNMPMAGREDITFLLGQHEDPNNPFYQKAFFHYANDPQEKTAYIITNCRSLLDVRNYLASYPPANALPWGTINIVVPDNEWSHLPISIFPQGRQANLVNLVEVKKDADFPGLISKHLDASTTLFVQGCRAEQQTELTEVLTTILVKKQDIAMQPKSKYTPNFVFADWNF